MIREAFCAALLMLCAAAPTYAADFVPGRPGETESAIAVPAGHVQIETEIAGYSHSQDGGESWSALETTLRYGMAAGWDGEAIVAPYESVRAGGEKTEGVGDLTVRLRKTLKDEDGTSLGVIGYVTLPTASNDLGAEDVEGGLIAAGAFDLNAQWSLAWTLAAGAASSSDGYHGAYSQAVTLSRQFTARTGGYLELFAEESGADTAATFDAGITHLVSPEMQIDAGVECGLSDSADDLRVFAGWARRF